MNLHGNRFRYDKHKYIIIYEKLNFTYFCTKKNKCPIYLVYTNNITINMKILLLNLIYNNNNNTNNQKSFI